MKGHSVADTCLVTSYSTILGLRLLLQTAHGVFEGVGGFGLPARV